MGGNASRRVDSELAMEISGWGRYPRIQTTLHEINSVERPPQDLSQGPPLIAYGLGRSYGDSALNAHVLSTRGIARIIHFDREAGLLTCEAGLSLAEAIQEILPRGWFLPVTPGTRFVTMGGAVAADVHGKNHHGAGCFGAHVRELSLLLPNGDVVRCSPEQNSALFRATCGGMGLTGVILTVTLQLRKVGSAYIRETTLKAAHLDEVLAQFDEHAAVPYSVAWIDCLSTRSKLGRAILFLGQHADDGEYTLPRESGIGIPIELPGFILNRYAVRLFQELYYRQFRGRRRERRIHLAPFFYPLDAIHHWNRIYGSRGFLQYQCVLPKSGGAAGLRKILTRTADAALGSFLAVLKLFGAANDNPLSFPMEGYTLALDFKYHSALLGFLDELDHIVADCGGRVYLAKDARMSAEMFRRGYPQWEKFSELRERSGADRTFQSLQSQRLGL